MASDTVYVGQLICDSTTPPPDRGFYKINDTTTGHVGKLVMSDPVSGKESVALTATLSDGGVGFTSVMGPISAAEYAALTPSADVAYFVTGVGVYVGASLIADLGGVGGTSRQFALRKRGMLIANNATSTLVSMSQSGKTVTFPAGVRLIDDTVGFYYELPAQQVLNLGAYNTGLIYFDTADNSLS